MCGFLGYIGPFHVADTEFRKVLEMSAHRGPDNQGVHRHGEHMFGFNRLAIQDLSESGNQPMVGEDGRHLLLFNGEVYNHMELRKAFGITECKGHGDTETLFHLFRRHGFRETIDRLDGMFAICWVDYGAGKAYLARDMAGIKPLYWHCVDSLVFASQLDQVLSFPVAKTHRLVRENLVDYFSLGYMTPPETIYDNIRQVMPGETVCFDVSGPRFLEAKTYYRFERERAFTGKGYVERLGRLIEGSVKDELVSDVPVASFMSGGIDSPIVNAYAKLHKPDLRAFTFQNPYERSLDESIAANALSRIIGLDYSNVTYDESSVQSTIDEHFRFMGEPCGDFSTIPTFILCKRAKEDATVIVSGDGGDELFYGYSRHLSFLKYRSLFSLPTALRRLASKPLRALTGIKVSNAILAHEDPGAAYRETQTSMGREDLRRILGSDRHSKACDRVFSVDEGGRGKALTDIITKGDYYGYLQRVLRKVDMMSMASSVEVRVPYLCRTVIDHSRSYQPEVQGEADLKKPLKTLFSELYPGGGTFHRKIGFTIPIGQLLRGPLRADLLAFTVERPPYGSELISHAEVVRYIEGYLGGSHSNHQGAWHIYAWQKWAHACKLID